MGAEENYGEALFRMRLGRGKGSAAYLWKRRNLRGGSSAALGIGR